MPALHDIQKVAKSGVPYFHILDITGDIYFTQLKNISRDKIGKLFHYGVLNAGQKQ